MVLFEDDRTNYGEQRMIGIGLLDYLVVLIVHVEDDKTIHIISMRRADSNETDIYYQTAVTGNYPALFTRLPGCAARSAAAGRRSAASSAEA